MNLVPLHFAALEGCGGPSYVISFFGGCMVVIIALWTMRFLRELYRHDYKFGRAYAVLPSFHLRLIWFQGCLSGVLLCLGKFMTIIAVTHLGNSVGNCFAQGSMLVSGLWWVFRFSFSRGIRAIFVGSDDRFVPFFYSPLIFLYIFAASCHNDVQGHLQIQGN
jgi:hypothetical protein